MILNCLTKTDSFNLPRFFDLISKTGLSTKIPSNQNLNLALKLNL